MNDVDVIILELDGGDHLRACLQSLARQTDKPRNIIVFDNGSKSPAAGRVLPVDGLQILRSETNLGFTGGVNAAMQHVRAPFVALINNDVILDPEWLATLVGAIERNEKVAAVQTVLRSPSMTIDGAGISISDGTFRQIGHGAPVARLEQLEKAWGVSATAALYRVAALHTASIDGNVLHPAFFAYYEDVELSARLHAHGFETLVLPVIRATHAGSATAGTLGIEGRRLRIRNRYFVHRLHPSVGRLGALMKEDAKSVARAGSGAERRAILSGARSGLLGTIALTVA